MPLKQLPLFRGLVLAVLEEILRHEVLAREADDATGREKLTLGPVPLLDDTPPAKAVRAILVHLSLRDEPRPPPVTQGAYWRF